MKNILGIVERLSDVFKLILFQSEIPIENKFSWKTNWGMFSSVSNLGRNTLIDPEFFFRQDVIWKELNNLVLAKSVSFS